MNVCAGLWVFCSVCFVLFFLYYCVLDSEAPPFPRLRCLSGLSAALTRAPAGDQRGGTEGEKGAGRGSQRAGTLETTRRGGNSTARSKMQRKGGMKTKE